ncbi:MAG TPA: SDR family oxidoreductase [Gaiellaceae bacterium]|nr:SDR family oxidoreductase [Gaiellaceae bacterium]
MTAAAARAVVVTGASSGIGAEIARAFGATGAGVVLVGRDEERLSMVARAVEEGGGTARPLSVDLTDHGRLPEIVAAALESFGRIDVLVHAAGIYLPEAVEDVSAEAFDRQWAVHVRAPFFLTQAALPHLRPGASVLFVTSQLAHIGASDAVAYCATKGAADLLAKAMAVELAARGIRVNCIAPGLVQTPMNVDTRDTAEFRQAVAQQVPLGRMGAVAEVAPLAVFLASEAAGYITGASIAVDGGSTAH